LALKSAVKWEFGYTSQGILHVWTPSLEAARPGDGAVHDRIVLPDVEVAPDPLARVVHTAVVLTCRALDGPAADVLNPNVELVGEAVVLLKPDV